MTTKFTHYLLEKYSDDFRKATETPFLAQAGQGTIAPGPLKEWLRQDYLYAYGGYIKFASALLSHLHLPTHPSSSTANTERAVSVLTFSLSNVKRETEFFISTAQQHGLDLFADETDNSESETGGGAKYGLLGEYNPVTRSYVDFLHAIGGLGGIEEGLVLLWGMEVAYLTAWNYAKSQRNLQPSSGELTETQKALEKFIENWTCDEFVEFVNGCEEIVDGSGIELGSEVAKRCEEVFKRTLWLEQRFWPTIE
ncbi:hypothetical protein IAR55_002133 [Kwoniella newhampshirensis]|uniref:Thiaminase-2/PQQC domain-containing protein n=1 Tax=Kwoniella newhampshirensis TaxID=1651941 RepID=A0AAW0YSY1_9TREE